MSQTALPHDAKAGPTKPEVRAVTLGKLDLQPSDHFVDVGSCTGGSVSTPHGVPVGSPPSNGNRTDSK